MGEQRSPVRVIGIPLLGGPSPADIPGVNRPLKLTVVVSLLAYAAGAVAFLWRDRAA
jgi:hypothetical protein